MNIDLEGIRIPDSKLAAGNNGAGAGYRTATALSSFEPRLLLGRSGRQASRTEIRSRNCFMRARCSMIWA